MNKASVFIILLVLVTLETVQGSLLGRSIPYTPTFALHICQFLHSPDYCIYFIFFSNFLFSLLGLNISKYLPEFLKSLLFSGLICFSTRQIFNHIWPQLLAKLIFLLSPGRKIVQV